MVQKVKQWNKGQELNLQRKLEEQEQTFQGKVQKLEKSMQEQVEKMTEMQGRSDLSEGAADKIVKMKSIFLLSEHL